MKFVCQMICGLIAAAVLFPVFAERSEVPVIEVVGEAEAVLEPDYAQWVVEITTQDKIAKLAMNVNNALYEDLLKIADDADVKDEDIVAGKPTVEQRFRGNSKTRVDWDQYQGTEIKRRVTFKMRDMDEIEKALDAVHQLGVVFVIRYKSTAYDQAVKQVKLAALKDAKQRATEQAAALGQGIGPAVYVEVTSESPTYDSGGLFGYEPMIEEDDTAAGPDGKVHVTAYASVEFKLEP